MRRGITNESQERINKLIRENQIRAVYNENSKHMYDTKGWKIVSRITGKNTRSENISSLIDQDLINEYFQEINTAILAYTPPILLFVPERTCILTVDVCCRNIYEKA